MLFLREILQLSGFCVKYFVFVTLLTAIAKQSRVFVGTKALCKINKAKLYCKNGIPDVCEHAMISLLDEEKRSKRMTARGKRRVYSSEL